MSFLGRFLVEQGAITEGQLEDGLRFQHEHNRRIGEVAVDRGVLTPEQVLAIREKQQDDSRLFGDIAVTERRLSRRSLDDLLFFQKVQHTYLGEALLVLGHISRDQYQRLMYSKKATLQLTSAATYQARCERFLRWPYQAKVMRTLPLFPWFNPKLPNVALLSWLNTPLLTVW